MKALIAVALLLASFTVSAAEDWATRTKIINFLTPKVAASTLTCSNGKSASDFASKLDAAPSVTTFGDAKQVVVALKSTCCSRDIYSESLIVIDLDATSKEITRIREFVSAIDNGVATARSEVVCK